METSNTLQLSCKTAQKCRRCDIVYIIIHYITPLMQCVTNDIKDYHMQLITTKCLNTAVMLMFFLLGRKGISHANYCDSRDMVERHKKGTDNKKEIITRMQRVILSPHVKNRYIYYILMNDAEFPHPTHGSVFFPGHVFLIERSYEDSRGIVHFNIYQSYINKYTLKEYYQQMNNTLRVKFVDIQRLLQKIKYILFANTWDVLCVKYWKDFTHVDTSNLLGAKHKDHLFICFSHEKLTTCIDNISKYAQDKLTDLEQSKASPTDTYGDSSLYRKDQAKPLSNQEMKHSLQNILKDINKNKNRI